MPWQHTVTTLLLMLACAFQGFMGSHAMPEIGHPAPALISAAFEGSRGSAGDRPGHKFLAAQTLSLTCDSESITDSTAVVPHAVPSEGAGHDGPPAAALPSLDDFESSDASAAIELPVQMSQEDEAKFLHSMRWLQTLDEGRVAEDWLQMLDELEADCPEFLAGGTHACPAERLTRCPFWCPKCCMQPSAALSGRAGRQYFCTA